MDFSGAKIGGMVELFLDRVSCDEGAKEDHGADGSTSNDSPVG